MQKLDKSLKAHVMENLCKTFTIIGIMAILPLSCTGQKGEENLRKICRLPAELRESSGIVISGPNLIWSHNDANNTPQLFAFDTLGALKRTLSIVGYSNIDWEDLTRDDDSNIYIADLGNNNNSRTDLCILRIPDPDNISGEEVIPEIIRISYSNQTAFPPPATDKNFDVESLIWREGFLYLFTKDRSLPFTGISKIYKVPAHPGVYTIEPQAHIYLGNDPEKSRVTSAAYNRHNDMLCLLTHDRILCFTNYPDDHFFEGQLTTYYLNPLPGQNEAIDFYSKDKIMMTEEGSVGGSGFLYMFHFPPTAGNEDFSDTNPKLTVWTSPSSGQLFFRPKPLNIHNLKILGMDGKMYDVYTGSSGSIDISKLKPGLYILILLDAIGIISGKAHFWVP